MEMKLDTIASDAGVSGILRYVRIRRGEAELAHVELDRTHLARAAPD